MKKYGLKNAQKDLPFRRRMDSKTRGGKSLIIAGSPGLWGAAVLCGLAAARSGAGYTNIYDPKSQFPVGKFPDFIIRNTVKDFSQMSSVAIGPGAGGDLFLLKCIRQLIKSKVTRVVVDAEALNAIARTKKPLVLPRTWILTPHAGELARLLGVSSQKISGQRKKYIKQAQKKMGCIVLLKGSKTLIADQTSLIEIQSGNSSLAKAGTGDVLTGIIAGFLSQKLKPINAACLAAFVHGYISDNWILKGQDQISLLASDLVKSLPETLRQIRCKK